MRSEAELVRQWKIRLSDLRDVVDATPSAQKGHLIEGLKRHACNSIKEPELHMQ